MANTYSAGIVTAYGAAKKAGYTGTYEEFCAEQANFGRWAQQVRQDKESVEQTVETFSETTVPAAVQSVTDEGTAQVGLVTNAGTTAVDNVNGAGTTQVGKVNTAGDNQVSAVNQAGTTQTGAVNQAGANQVTAVNQAGATQVQAVEDKGEEVIDSIPQDYTDLVDDVADLSRQISDVESESDYLNDSLFRISGQYFNKYIKGLYRYVNNGAEATTNNERMISPALGQYFTFVQGDRVVSLIHERYNFRVCISTDGGETYTMTSQQSADYTVPAGGIGWIVIICSTTATDEDYATVCNGNAIEIQRSTANITQKNSDDISGTMDAIAMGTGFEIKSISDNLTFIWVNTTATENGGILNIFDIPAIQGDIFRIKFDIIAQLYPENYSDYYLIVREIGTDGSSPLRSMVCKLSDSNVADFTVKKANTTKIIANINLKRSSEPVSASYYERVKYGVTVIKINEQNDVYTEAGDTWEV